MERKEIVRVVSSLYFIIVGAYIIFENTTIYFKYSPISILVITYLQAALLMSSGIFRRKWLRILLISWSIMCLTISVITWFFGVKSVIKELLYYAVPLFILLNPKVKEQFR